jgi:FkbM family methyltransferase
VEAGLFAISSLLPALPPLKIIDVGARSEGDAPPYAALLKAAPCSVYGFEPDIEEWGKLDRTKKDGQHFLPFAVGDGSTQTFHECTFPATSSIFEPNTPLLAKFQFLEELTRVTRSYRVDTRRLDDIAEIAGADFLKADVQGAELLVFRGAIETLRSVLVVHTEVIFVPLYKHQPLFGDVDCFLRAQGFQFHRLIGTAGRTFKPLTFINNPAAGMSQMLWGNVVYVRDFMDFDRLAPASLLKLAVILHENYGAADLAAVALESYDRQTGSSLQPPYIARLINPAP